MLCDTSSSVVDMILCEISLSGVKNNLIKNMGASGISNFQCFFHSAQVEISSSNKAELT